MLTISYKTLTTCTLATMYLHYKIMLLCRKGIRLALRSKRLLSQNPIQEPVIINMLHAFKHFYITFAKNQVDALNFKQTSIKNQLDLVLNHCQFSFPSFSRSRIIHTSFTHLSSDCPNLRFPPNNLVKVKLYLGENQKRVLKILHPHGVRSWLLRWDFSSTNAPLKGQKSETNTSINQFSIDNSIPNEPSSPVIRK